MSEKMNVGKKHSNINYDKKILEVKNLKKHFKVGVGKNKLIVRAVDDVTFDIHQREIFGLVGESGCGKTTTGRTIIKLYNPTEGTVRLNDLNIGAGYEEYLAEIKRIKAKLKFDIISLDENKLEEYKINQKLAEDIADVEREITYLNFKLKEDIKKAKEPISNYKQDKYKLSEQFKLDIENVKYQFIIHKDLINDQTKNQALVEYDNEKSIEKIKYNNKLIGLKESAALQKEEIKKRIDLLKEEYNQNLKNLDDVFLPLIKEGEEKLKPKAEARAEIAQANEEKKAEIARLREQYKKDQEALIEPDYEAIKAEEAQIKLNNKEEISKKRDEIANLKENARNEIAEIRKRVNELTLEEKAAKKEATIMLKQEAKQQIRLQKSKISEARRINSSNEAIEMSRKMQMIFQDPISSLNPRMTVREIVGEGLIVLGQHTKEEINQKVADALELVGLSPEHAMRYPHEFSGGQRQRIGIARALIMDPNFIIADEPVSALDVSIQAQVINLLFELKNKLDLTILFIAHDLSVVRFFCDRIAVMYMGKILEMAESEELFAYPMHPYTKSLLSAIPQPDPDFERDRKRIHYDPRMHDYTKDKPSLRELSPGHYIYLNDAEFEKISAEYNELSKGGKKKK